MFALASHSQTKSGYELLTEFEIGFDKNISKVYGIILKCYRNYFFYFYRCTVHFEDSLIITYQQLQ
jgi:hypothetical protein